MEDEFEDEQEPSSNPDTLVKRAHKMMSDLERQAAKSRAAVENYQLQKMMKRSTNAGRDQRIQRWLGRTADVLQVARIRSLRLATGA